MVWSILAVAFLIGMQHALEADHVAAVSSIASRRSGVGSVVRLGATWGLGHAAALLILGGAAVASHASLDAAFVHVLELAVGVMLAALGANVLWRLRSDGVHFHGHSHGEGPRHFHAHSHRADAKPHSASKHDHGHPQGLPWRTFAVGLMHGAAGTATLVTLAAALHSPLWGLVYILVFGVGSIVGMTVLSAAIAVPLAFSAKSLTLANRAVRAAIGMVTIAIGADLMWDSAQALDWLSGLPALA